MAFLLSQSPVSAEVVVPEKARVMTGVELYMMFRDKTWKWENGAGRMQGEGRVFRAWAQSEAGATWAEGRWSVTDGGQLCLKGVWHSQSAAARDKTCFTHRILDGTIYQKREPAGDWYVFRHARPAADDAFNRLIVEDLVEAKLPIIRAVLNAHAEAKTNSVRPQTEANEVGGVQ
ncbi:DUF995 domain-containing protein [Sinorhizobium sp. 6-70]|nr:MULTISPECIES: DUF995 domain-containing protein [unclassified Sinorhizobium]MDK1377614.1 DUF995 domain-containing protein [Sinorhizobium sp. 6-70]MDK1480950.1 DUF995 domain-containing protein [Sinorhizobium sp. 6-117]